jgi:hypothetical protein
MATETIYALFRTVADAERAIGALMDHGVERDNIGVIARQTAEQDEEIRVRTGYVRSSTPIDDTLDEPVAAYTPRPTTMPPAAISGTVVPTSDNDTPQSVETAGKEGITTTTGADAGAGAAIGTGIGLVAGLLASAIALTVPGVGIVLAAGAVTSAIGATVAATAAGAIAGGVAGYLRDMGMNEAAASSYADRVSQGDYLIAVTVDTSDYDDVRRILYKYNAVGVDVNVNTAGEPVRSAWGNDPVLVEYLSRPSSRLGSPMPVRRIVTEDPDGTPVIPAREAPNEPGWTGMGMSPKESEAALDRDMDLDDDEIEYRNGV